jgi:hypothetical protein
VIQDRHPCDVAELLDDARDHEGPESLERRPVFSPLTQEGVEVRLGHTVDVTLTLTLGEVARNDHGTVVFRSSTRGVPHLDDRWPAHDPARAAVRAAHPSVRAWCR